MCRLIVVPELLRPMSVAFILRVAQVAGGVWLLSGWSILGVLPILLMCALSTLNFMVQVEGHYVLGLGAPLFIAIAVGMNNMSKRVNAKTLKKILTVTTLIALTQLGFGEPNYFLKLFGEYVSQ